MVKTMLTRCVLCAFVCVCAGVAGVQAEQESAVQAGVSSSFREIEGEVSSLGKDYVAVVYARDEETKTEKEILLPFEQSALQLVHKQKLSEIQVGDRIRVRYEETVEPSGDSSLKKIKAQRITFVKPSASKAYTPQAEESAVEAELPLKGTK